MMVTSSTCNLTANHHEGVRAVWFQEDWSSSAAADPGPERWRHHTSAQPGDQSQQGLTSSDMCTCIHWPVDVDLCCSGPTRRWSTSCWVWTTTGSTSPESRGSIKTWERWCCLQRTTSSTPTWVWRHQTIHSFLSLSTTKPDFVLLSVLEPVPELRRDWHQHKEPDGGFPEEEA